MLGMFLQVGVLLPLCILVTVLSAVSTLVRESAAEQGRTCAPWHYCERTIHVLLAIIALVGKRHAHFTSDSEHVAVPATAWAGIACYGFLVATAVAFPTRVQLNG